MMEMQKAADDGQNKEKINTSGQFIVLTTCRIKNIGSTGLLIDKKMTAYGHFGTMAETALKYLRNF